MFPSGSGEPRAPLEKAEYFAFFFWAQAASGIPSRSGSSRSCGQESGLVLNRERARLSEVSWLEKKARVLSVCLSVGAAQLSQARKPHRTIWEQRGDRGLPATTPPPSPGAVWLNFRPFVS